MSDKKLISQLKILCILSCFLLFIGCNHPPEDRFPKDYFLGAIESSDTYNLTIITLWNEQGENIYQKKIAIFFIIITNIFYIFIFISLFYIFSS